jgi:hypothetical protein
LRGIIGAGFAQAQTPENPQRRTLKYPAFFYYKITGKNTQSLNHKNRNFGRMGQTTEKNTAEPPGGLTAPEGTDPYSKIRKSEKYKKPSAISRPPRP